MGKWCFRPRRRASGYFGEFAPRSVAETIEAARLSSSHAGVDHEDAQSGLGGSGSDRMRREIPYLGGRGRAGCDGAFRVVRRGSGGRHRRKLQARRTASRVFCARRASANRDEAPGSHREIGRDQDQRPLEFFDRLLTSVPRSDNGTSAIDPSWKVRLAALRSASLMGKIVAVVAAALKELR